MSTEETPKDSAPAAEVSAASAQPPTEPAAMATGNKKRPRLDLEAITGAGGAGAGRERKRGKSMFGLVLGTLNRAKIEDKERNASEAAKKRQLIEQRLQNKLKKETDTVRRAEEAKKDKMTANRKEEELQLKDSIYKYRRGHLIQVANFLLTSDTIPLDDSESPSSSNPLANPPRSHPPPLYYLPAVLLPSQEAFLARRKQEVTEASEKEWSLFLEERSKGVEEVDQLRQHVAEEESRKKTENGSNNDNNHNDDVDMESGSAPAPVPEATSTSQQELPKDESEYANMEVDKGLETEESKKPEPASTATSALERNSKDESAPMQAADDEDAVEY